TNTPFVVPGVVWSILTVGVAAKAGSVTPVPKPMKNGLPVTPNAAPVLSTGSEIGTQTTLVHTFAFLNVITLPVASLPVQSANEGDARRHAAPTRPSRSLRMVKMSLWKLPESGGDADVAAEREVHLPVRSRAR